MKNETFTKDEIKAIEKFLDFSKEYFEEEAKHYCGEHEKLFKAMIDKMVTMDTIHIAIKVCKENQDNEGNVKVNVL